MLIRRQGRKAVCSGPKAKARTGPVRAGIIFAKVLKSVLSRVMGRGGCRVSSVTCLGEGVDGGVWAVVPVAEHTAARSAASDAAKAQSSGDGS